MDLRPASASAAAPAPAIERDAEVASVRPGRDLAAIALLFLVMRFGMALFLLPGGHFFRGDADFLFFRRFAELSTAGLYPFLDYWMEYPPVFPWIVVGIYRLALLLPAWPDPLIWFQVLTAGLLSLADLANLGLVYLIAKRLHGPATGRRAAIYYALLFFPAYAALGWFDALPLLFLLMTVWLSLANRPALAGLAAGLGLMTKAIPAIALPIGLLGARDWRGRIVHLLAFGLSSAAIGLPFLVASPTMTLASLRAMSGRSSWESVWSCLEGYCGFGIVPEVAARFDPGQATTLFHPETLPWPAITAALVLSLSAVYASRLRWREPIVQVTAIALTLNLLLLLSKGYSPQFLVYPLALLIVLKPRPLGVLQACLLTLVSLVEYPFAIAVVFGNPTLQFVAIGFRTALLVLLTAEYALALAGPDARTRARLRSAVVGLFLVVGVVGLGVGTYMVGAEFVRANPTRHVAARVAALQGADDAVVASSREAFYRTRPVLPASGWLLAESDANQWPMPLGERLDALVAGRAAAWLILDHGTPDPKVRDELLAHFDRWGARATDEFIGQYRLVGYVAHGAREAGSRPGAVPLAARFGEGLSVVGRGPLPEAVAAGDAIRLTVQVRCDAPPAGEIKAFVHLADATGKPAAQRDKPLLVRGEPASVCRPGESFWDGADLVVPSGTPPGDYSLVMGYYDPATGARLPLAAGGDLLRLAGVRVTAER